MNYYIEIKQVIRDERGSRFTIPIYYSGTLFNQIQFNNDFNKREVINTLNNAAEEYTKIKTHFNLNSLHFGDYFVEIKTSNND